MTYSKCRFHLSSLHSILSPMACVKQAIMFTRTFHKDWFTMTTMIHQLLSFSRWDQARSLHSLCTGLVKVFRHPRNPQNHEIMFAKSLCITALDNYELQRSPRLTRVCVHDMRCPRLVAVIQREMVQCSWRRTVISLPTNIASTSDSSCAGSGLVIISHSRVALHLEVVVSEW